LLWSRVLPSFKSLLHCIARLIQNSKTGSHIVEVRDRALPWDHLNIWSQLRYDLLHGIDHATDAAAALQVDEWEAVGDKIVAHVHQV